MTTRKPKQAKRTVTGATLGRGATEAEARADAMVAALEAPVERRVDQPTRTFVEGRGQDTIAGPRATPNQLGDQVGDRAVVADAPAGPYIGPIKSNLDEKQAAYDEARRARRRR